MTGRYSIIYMTIFEAEGNYTFKFHASVNCKICSQSTIIIISYTILFIIF